MKDPREAPAARRILHGSFLLLGSIGLTVVFFLVLPLMQAISSESDTDQVPSKVEPVTEQPPPTPEEPEPEPEPEPEEQPELQEDPQRMDLSQLELRLDPGGLSGGWVSGGFDMKLDAFRAGRGEDAGISSLIDLDRKPRPVYQPSPVPNAQTRRKGRGSVVIVFLVDEEGRVVNPAVKDSTDPVFEGPALAAVKRWRFEPQKQNGRPARFRMRQEIVFPEG